MKTFFINENLIGSVKKNPLWIFSLNRYIPNPSAVFYGYRRILWYNTPEIMFQLVLRNRHRRPEVFRPFRSCPQTLCRRPISRTTRTSLKRATPARPTRRTNRSISRRPSVITVHRKCRGLRPCSTTAARPSRKYIQPSNSATMWVHTAL
jgi:hypothetical protein